jgi:hypothetical protein
VERYPQQVRPPLRGSALTLQHPSRPKLPRYDESSACPIDQPPPGSHFAHRRFTRASCGEIRLWARVSSGQQPTTRGLRLSLIEAGHNPIVAVSSSRLGMQPLARREKWSGDQNSCHVLAKNNDIKVDRSCFRTAQMLCDGRCPAVRATGESAIVQ